MRTLVVYYSRSGNTGLVAEQLARALEADVEKLVDRTQRSGVFGYMRSGYESVKKRAAAIAPTAKNPGDYDLVLIGTPVWVGDVSSPVRAYLETMRGRLPKVAFFCTMGGRGSEQTFRSMEALAGVKPVTCLALRERAVETLRSIHGLVASLEGRESTTAARAPTPTDGAHARSMT